MNFLRSISGTQDTILTRYSWFGCPRHRCISLYSLSAYAAKIQLYFSLEIKHHCSNRVVGFFRAFLVSFSSNAGSSPSLKVLHSSMPFLLHVLQLLPFRLCQQESCLPAKSLSFHLFSLSLPSCFKRDGQSFSLGSDCLCVFWYRSQAVFN